MVRVPVSVSNRLQRGRADVEQQHQRDAGAGGGHRMHRQQTEEKVGGDARQRLRAQLATSAEHEQQRGDEEVGQGDRARAQRVAQRFDQPGGRSKQEEHQQRRLEQAVEREEVQLAAKRAVGVGGDGRPGGGGRQAAFLPCENDVPSMAGGAAEPLPRAPDRRAVLPGPRGWATIPPPRARPYGCPRASWATGAALAAGILFTPLGDA